MRPAQRRPQSRNRRVSNVRQRRQQHLLDVKVRSRKAAQHRARKILAVLSRVVLLAALCAAIYAGTREAARRLFFENADYTLKTIELQTDGTLQREQILNAADLHEGENIFRVNLSRVHDLIQQLPQTDEVQIVRKLPSEIDVRVVERKPVAWITSEKEISDPFASESAFLVDARGVLMKEKKLLPEYLGLPVILGCSSESLEVGKVVESPEAWKALELLRLSSRSFLQMRFQIREIDVSESYHLLVTDKNHSRVTFGYNDLETQLRRLEQFLVYCDDSKQELATLNLLVQRNIPVTFAPRPVAVINDTIEPAVEPRIMKAIPVQPAETSPRQGSGKQETTSPPRKARTSSKPPPRAIPIQRQKTD
jgi:cell division septal protein FtsQ